MDRYTCMRSERNVPEVPQTVYANTYYGQNPMIPVSAAMAPSNSTLSSASQWVAIAAESLNAEVRTSNLRLPSSSYVPGVSHAHNGSDSRGVGYGYQNPAYHGSHQTLSVTTDQGVNNWSNHAYDIHPHYVSSYHTQNQGDSARSHTWASGSSGVSVDNAYTHNNSNNHSTSVSYGNSYTQGYLPLPPSQPSVSSVVDAGNSYIHYYGANSATATDAYGNQDNYSFH